MKPYEVELLVAEVGHANDDHAEMYHVLYDGVVDRRAAVLRARRPGRSDHRGAEGAVHRRARARRRGAARRARCSARPASRSAPSSSRSRCSTAPGRVARSAASRTPSSKEILAGVSRRLRQARACSTCVARDQRSAATASSTSATTDAPPRHAPVADRRPVVVEDLVGLVDLVDEQHEARVVAWSSGTNTSTRARSPTVTAYGPSSAPRSCTSKPSASSRAATTRAPNDPYTDVRRVMGTSAI